MSYRAFKRLLGETSLERKCRFLLGAGIVLLMTLSFWIYARQTESLADEQTINTGRLLLVPALARLHHRGELDEALKEYQQNLEVSFPDVLSQHQLKFLSARSRDPARKPDADEQTLLNRFQNDPSFSEDTRSFSAEGNFYYYGAIRAEKGCLKCHPTVPGDPEKTAVAENDLLGVMRIRISTQTIKSAVHQNRAILISTALLTALLIMAGSYLIIRYIIVKPVKHLKEVSDAISNGHLNVRSEIQTGDEFEDLSDAFNRMLRKLTDMQEESRKLNSDLDRKVDELAQANMSLFESNRLKGDFLATVSHELRTPLNSILGFSEVLLSANQTLNEKQARWVVNIRSSGQQLLSLINDILDLARIEAGKMEIHPSEIQIADLFDELLNMFRPLAGKKNIDVRSRLETNLPFIRQDRGKLRQIVSNLVSNAIKFTPEGGRVTLSAEADAEFLLIAVVDTGVGIAPEEQEAVFDKFRQAGNPLTREHEGTGLGLSIVRELCRLLGGEISLKSELGRGSSFSVRLPLELPGEPQFDPSEPVSRLPSLAARTSGTIVT